MTELCIHEPGDADEAAVQRGCDAARRLIESRGFTVDAAYQAVLARANNERFDRRAAQAWDAAEDAAFAAAFGPDDEWPEDAVLGIRSETA
ncbi:MAG TPA: hypothetical protein VM491_13130 [Burkholderiaceae bacterium]|jgi:hypothetical protein|nr:hypothetical protein [Burkholderiaceae bacterium]